MTVRESILTGIRTRQFMRVEFTDSEGRSRTEVLEGYTLGYDNIEQEVVTGFIGRAIQGHGIHAATVRTPLSESPLWS
jgi:hypothetical protein